ncbi:MAG: DUF4332 domain-containing protein [Oscillospiraceae bacterium]|nr:DUF4332 domain-containing protein [Oscillospiraceae bacterium]
MKYSADLGKLKLEEYQELLKSQNLLPGRKLLQLNLDATFFKIKDAEINNLDELAKAISAPSKLKAFSKKAEIAEKYLVLLKRELGSLQPKPISLKDFSRIPVDIIEDLNKTGIKTSKDFYELFTSSDNSKLLIEAHSLSADTAYKLFCLCSLSRINGIGAAAAQCFYDSGYHSIDDVAGGNASEMLNRLNSANDQSKYYKASLGTKDTQFCIDYAKMQKLLF